LLWSENITPYSYPKYLEQETGVHHDAINKIE